MNQENSRNERPAEQNATCTHICNGASSFRALVTGGSNDPRLAHCLSNRRTWLESGSCVHPNEILIDNPYTRRSSRRTRSSGSSQESIVEALCIPLRNASTCHRPSHESNGRADPTPPGVHCCHRCTFASTVFRRPS